VHTKVKFANEFHNPGKLDVGDNFMAWLDQEGTYREKWVHMSKTGYLGLFTFFSFPAPECPDEGVYIWGTMWESS
jgi:hypothetical protein